jgi:hypothetical protein
MEKENQTENQNPEQAAPTGELNGQQALNVLIQAVRIAQGKGAYTIEDAELISRAIKVFVPPTPVGEDGAPTSDPVINKDEEIAEVPAEPVMTKVGE